MKTEQSATLENLTDRGTFPPGKKSDRGRTAKNNRPVLEAILWRANGARLRGILEHLGKWNSIHQSFRGWVELGVFERIHRESCGKIDDLECAMIEGTIVQVHQKASGARKVLGKQAIGRSRDGFPVLAETHGRLVDFRLLPGQAHELTGTRSPLNGASFRASTEDRAFDAEWLLADLDRQKAKAVIPSRTHRKVWRGYDGAMYEWRHRDRKLREDQGIQNTRDAIWQN